MAVETREKTTTVKTVYVTKVGVFTLVGLPPEPPIRFATRHEAYQYVLGLEYVYEQVKVGGYLTAENYKQWKKAFLRSQSK